LGNGVDSDHFSPDPQRASPFAPGECALVFTGAMDYWPNVDAVTWFATEMMPTLRERWPELRFHIVGRDPTAAVRALASDAVAVSGTVPDVRPYLQHAAAVVAPLRLARGVQNKVLEAMAMGRPVICAAPCTDAIGARSGTHLLAAEEPGEYIAAIDRVLREPAFSRSLGATGSSFMRERFSWHAHLADWDDMLDTTIARRKATQTQTV
jgi:sugar transferase (PEP-CTERM/EpsH1 system associated)